MKLEKCKLMLFHNMLRARTGSSRPTRTSFGKSSLARCLWVNIRGCLSLTIGIFLCSHMSQGLGIWHTQRSCMLISPFLRRKWTTTTKRILKLRWGRRRSNRFWRNTRRKRCSLERFLWCWGPSSVSWRSLMKCRGSRMERTARLTKEDTLLSTVRKRLLLHKREWEITKSMFLPRNHHPSTHGWQRFDHRPKLQIDLLSCSLCKWNRAKEEKVPHQVLEKTHQSIAQFR